MAAVTSPTLVARAANLVRFRFTGTGAATDTFDITAKTGSPAVWAFLAAGPLADLFDKIYTDIVAGLTAQQQFDAAAHAAGYSILPHLVAAAPGVTAVTVTVASGAKPVINITSSGATAGVLTVALRHSLIA